MRIPTDLNEWSSLLGIIGFIGSLITGIIGLMTRSEVSRLRRSVLFDKRIPVHIKELTQRSTNINRFLSGFAQHHRSVKNELEIILAELHDLEDKLPYFKRSKCRNLIFSIRYRRGLPFVNYQRPLNSMAYLWHRMTKGLFQTDEENIHQIYVELNGIIAYVENMHKNKKATI
jgi:hypothetical protein